MWVHRGEELLRERILGVTSDAVKCHIEVNLQYMV